MHEEALKEKARKIKILFTDNDGVLTDNGVYYGETGEVLKRFSIRDGMGVERLKKLCSIDTGIITGETSPSVKKRAEKLGIINLHLGIKDKVALLQDILQQKNITPDEIAYIGDDVNDLQIIEKIGLSACPGDAMPQVVKVVDYVCTNKGGHGAFREFAELIIAANTL